MTDLLKNCISENQDLIVDVIEQGAEVMASIAGDLSPIFSILAHSVKLAMGNVESKDVQFMQEQLQKLQDRLAAVSEESQQIIEELKKSQAYHVYSSVENNLNNHFRKFTDIFKAKDQARESRKDMFMASFKRTGVKDNLNTLYDAVTGNNFSGESVLEITLNYEQKSRRAVEEFCAMLKNLFCIGLITLLGYTAMEGSGKEEDLRQDWGEKMKVVQSKMDEAIEECINSFPTQAELDAERIVRGRADKNNQQLADMLMDHLKKKYDWVCWSVRVFNSPTGLFANKKDFQGLMGNNQFVVSVSDEKLNVVISYSASPEPIDKALILTLILFLEQNKCIFKKSSMAMMSKQIFVTIPHCVVHTVKTSCKDLGFSCSFSDERHYSIKFENFHVFVHSEKNKEKNRKAIVNS
ncbi:protein rapunzel-like [Triplophysa rosa]|uniref:Rapunzel 4 n=1 Tax=Triplophysa rosa TaxID=992332 RepID=A0A9W7WQC9_TRIRA|nr:protein rapunzel-like [Triplophysa rosa]KAI7806535.1 rapunzel 4 [Triplophysa rosa]